MILQRYLRQRIVKKFLKIQRAFTSFHKFVEFVERYKKIIQEHREHQKAILLGTSPKIPNNIITSKELKEIRHGADLVQLLVDEGLVIATRKCCN